jgi:outer membrane receptor protein involved in Fe transport
MMGQNVGAIRGIVTDGIHPIEFANVYVSLPEDSSRIYSGVVTDSLGNFIIGKLPIREYVLSISTIGFKKKTVGVSLTTSGQQIDLGRVDLEADPQMLNAVEVKSMRDIIERTEGGLALNAKDNLTQAGGTAADLLRNMPGILVDADGAITIRGKSPLTLINGRISGIAGADRTADLSRIPASSIERIEIINNPSAKYDADAEGGVINIILKKNVDEGTNGAFAVGAGKGSRYRLNASGLVNHKTKKWNLGAAYDNWYTTRTRRASGDRTNFDIPDQYYLTQRRHDERLIFYQNAKANIDYTPNANNTLNIEALWAFPGENNHETLKNTNETSADDFVNRNQRYSNEIRRTHNIEINANYKKRFKDPTKLLTINVNDAVGNDRENTGITTSVLSQEDAVLGNSSIQRTHTYQTTNLLTASMDYSQALSEKLTFETGYKGIQRILNADYERATLVSGEYRIDPANTNIYDFREQIHAVYSQISGWSGEKENPTWKYSLGVRAEKVWNHGATLDQSETVKNKYSKLYPSVNVSYHASNNDIKLVYSRRINRPGLGQLNPFTDITDSLNQHSGNPHLKPEFVHSIELGHNLSISRFTLTTSLFFRIRNNAIFQYTVLDSNGVARMMPLNFGKASTYGIESIATYNVSSFWNFNLSVSAFETQIANQSAVANVAVNQFSWYGKLINNFSIGKRSKLQVIGNYVSPTPIPQGKSIPVYNVDAGFQHQIMKGNGRLGIVVTDIFNTQRSGSVTSAYNFYFNRIFKLDTRAVMLTFGYTFRSTFSEKLMENRFKND